jgi:hypothetical protein
MKNPFLISSCDGIFSAVSIEKKGTGVKENKRADFWVRSFLSA